MQGDPITAEMFNALLDEVHKLAKLTVQPPLEMSDGPWGKEIRVTGSVGSGSGGDIIRGILDTDMTCGGSATVSVWADDGTDADTGDDITAWDWLLLTGQSMDAGTKVVVGYDPLSDKNYVLTGSCVTADGTGE